MRNTLISIAIALTMLTACNKGDSSAKTDSTPEAAAAQIPDSLDNNQIIAWKATQGMPMRSADIDSIIAYFQLADQWTGEHLANVTTPEEFDKIDSLYKQQFPYMDIFSMILENQAQLITDSQMELMHQTAVSLGKKIEEAATRCKMPMQEYFTGMDSTLTVN